MYFIVIKEIPECINYSRGVRSILSGRAQECTTTSVCTPMMVYMVLFQYM